MKFNSSALLVAFLVCAMADLLFATTWIVDDDGSFYDFREIQDAVDAASNGDQILVMPGTYIESARPVIDFSGKKIQIIGTMSDTILKQSGEYPVVVAISEPIEASITATLIAKDSEGSRVRQVIARATSDLHEKMLKRVGADRVIFPSRMQGERLGLELVRPNLMERLALDEQHCIEEIKVPEPFVGRSLRDLNLRKNFRVNVLAAGPQSSLMVNPPASHVLEEGHLLVVMGLVDDLQRLPKI